MKRKLLKQLFSQEKEQTQHNIEQSSKAEDYTKKKLVEPNLDKTMETIKKIYSVPRNSDFSIRNIHIGGLGKMAAVLYISTITDTTIIEDHILRPLLQNKDANKTIENIISAPTITNVQVIEDIITNLNLGNTVLLIEGFEEAYVFSTAKFDGRSIEKAENEVVLKGPKEAFNESANSNISLIRKKIKNENLIVEASTISKRSKNELYILYVKDISNEKLLNKVKNKINSLDMDSIQNVSILEELIVDYPKSIFPTVLYTERPDRASTFLESGFIVLIMENSPAALILPATFWSFIHNPEDHYLRFIYGNFIRALRMVALFITLFISSIYISVTNYHAEMIPPDLLLAIAATREIVPFPAIVEILIMEICFELIREAGLRVPNPIGPTIGIVGALILGQAAVQANLVSPLVVIIVALGGLSSFAIGDINMNSSIRLIRFLFIFSAALFGFYGMTALFVLGIFNIVLIRSFGVPYFAPMTPYYKSSRDTIFRKTLKREIFRPGYIKPKDIQNKAGD
ncbi:spore germination protein KA [Ureibacillus xyleni]|uniref:Spore germination protein KA n=1 Tax=Ureibacillus xyleni TaxID=614648 RepID=A0A285SR72_9BACL|nr:spore germination protein [Ureibacillus xyleni]SOC10629.1 spore germination protein KA [Ureibacillus xyleni]